MGRGHEERLGEKGKKRDEQGLKERPFLIGEKKEERNLSPGMQEGRLAVAVLVYNKFFIRKQVGVSLKSSNVDFQWLLLQSASFRSGIFKV